LPRRADRMVHVVELAHARVAGLHHLGEGRPRQSAVVLRREPGGNGVHLLPPRPRSQLPTRSTNAVMRSTNASRWKRSDCSHVVSVVVSVTRSTKSLPSR